METGNNLGTNQPNVRDVGSNSGANQPNEAAVGSYSGANQPNVAAVGSKSRANQRNVSEKLPYEVALEDNWEGLKQLYDDGNAFSLSIPLTATKDTAFHLAVYSGSNDPIQHLLKLAKRNPNPMIEQPYTLKNAYGNTALHEAAANGNLDAVSLLVGYSHELVEVKNSNDETPIFRAAAYGQTKVLKFLASQPGQVTDGKLKEIHHYKTTLVRKEPDATKGEIKKVRDASILHVALQGGHFETALKLLKLDKSLSMLKDKNGMTSLQLLATIPSAFRSGYRMSAWKRFFYICLPIDDEHEEEVKNENHRFCYLYLSKGWPGLSKILVEKRKHKLAFKLTRKLIKRDSSWTQSIEDFLPTSSNEELDEELGMNLAISGENSRPIPLFLATERGIIEIVNEILKVCPQLIEHRNHLNQNILHVAIMNRQKEIFDRVKKMKIPMTRLVRGIDNNHYTILHYAADMKSDIGQIHRGPAYQLQDELRWFKRVHKIMPSHFAMFRVSDKDDHVEVVTPSHFTMFRVPDKDDHVKVVTPSHFAMFRVPDKDDNVEVVTPSHFAMFRAPDKDDNVKVVTPSHLAMFRVPDKDNHVEDVTYTCKELFNLKHRSLLKDAQRWIKETSQSCSAVAVLVATVVFAAAYTVPGGSDENGLPVFLDSPLFLFFTVMDVVSLACSLTSVVMFLSVLTSPFKFEDFLHSLPRKLTLGFTLLFLSLTTTMLAFTATIFLIIRLEKSRWTTTLIYTAAFLPVSIFALTQFPMFLAFTVTLSNIFKIIKKALPLKVVTSRLFAIRRQFRRLSFKKNDDSRRV